MLIWQCKPRLMSQALRKLSHSLSQSHTILIFINQVRAKLSTFGFGGPTEVTCGGNALKFYASVRLNIRRVGFIKKGEEFGKGISRESEIIELAVKHKFIKKNGAFYDCNGRKYHGKEALREFLAHNDDVQEELVMKLREKLLEAETDQELKDETTDGEPTHMKPQL
uniref:RecA family profile 2 domain-containing protein n=1 Tax=Salix viminalis TaxID=40686 RepID=A0A6N2N769_SALVM